MIFLRFTDPVSMECIARKKLRYVSKKTVSPFVVKSAMELIYHQNVSSPCSVLPKNTTQNKQTALSAAHSYTNRPTHISLFKQF